MVELALRALYESSAKLLSKHWTECQHKLDSNVMITDMEDQFVKGNLLVWNTILKRLCAGCSAKDSESIFSQWLRDYRNRLVEASSSENGSGNPYIEGQVDAFNAFLRSLAKLSKTSSQAYKKKNEEIEQKKRELEFLYDELEGIVWDLSLEAKDEVSGV